MDPTAERLLDLATGVRFADLPEATVHAVRRCLVDSVGCALAAVDDPAVTGLRALAARQRSDTPATVLGTDIRTTPEMAALVTGTMVRSLDFNDDYFGGAGDLGPHPSDNLGGILAAAESAGRDGRALVEGVVVAYEVVGRLVDVVRPRGRARTWDYTVFHAAATAIGAGVVLGLDRAALGHALGLAVVANVSLYQTRSGELSHWKGLAGPNASRNGLFAALLAAEGVTGPAAPFAGRAGLARHLDNPFDLDPTGPSPYTVERAFVKALPVRYTNQLPTWIALGLYGSVTPERVASIAVYGLGRDVVTPEDHPEQWAPTTRETADHSLPYLIGAALVDGTISDRTFTPERFRDPAILDLIGRIRFHEDPGYTTAFPATFGGRLEVTLDSGEVVVSELVNPKGHPGNPMSDAELSAKYAGLVRDVMPDDRAAALERRLWKVEAEPDLAGLLAAARVT